MDDDATLLLAWRGGDTKSGEALFDRYFETVSRFFARKLPAYKADLCQQTFMALLEGESRLEDPSKFRSYLFGIAYNVLRTAVRRRQRDQADDIEDITLADVDPSPSTIARAKAEHRALLDALRRIPMASQVLLELRYWENLDSGEIAGVLEIPRPTVRSRLRRARAELEEALRSAPLTPQLLESTIGGFDRWAAEIAAAPSSEPT